MRKFIILLSMSLCTFAEAQKAFEWQIKTGIYTDVYSLPKLREGLSWLNIGPKVYTSFSIGVDIKKWKTMIQLNADTRLTFWNSNIDWKNNSNYALPNISFFIPKEGDLESTIYSYFNVLNVLYKITKEGGRNRMYVGIGMVGRFESISYISYIEDPLVGYPVLLESYQGYRIAPSFKLEYQYNLSERFFISTHINYAWFDKTPHSYWQFALNGGIRF
jgi:hypothetical protein